MKDYAHIALSTVDAVHLIFIKDILYCKSNNSYTTFYVSGLEPIVVSKSIKEYEARFSNNNFFRVHQSYLVNFKHVKKINKTNGFSLLLSNDTVIPTSTRNHKKLLEFIQSE